MIAVAANHPHRVGGAALGPRRGTVALTVSLAGHALVVLGLALLATATRRASEVDQQGQTHAAAPLAQASAFPVTEAPPAAERLRALQAAVVAGRMHLGDAWIELEGARHGGGEPMQQALVEYRRLLSQLGERLRRTDEPLHRAIVAELRNAGLHYQRQLNRSLTEALLEGGGDCVARTRLISSLIHDLGFAGRAQVRVFSNHLAPVLLHEQQEHRFGMVATCTGLGVRIAAVDLMSAELPESADTCRDDAALFGSPMTDIDPPPSWSGLEPAGADHCPLAQWPWRQDGQAVVLSSSGPVPSVGKGQPVIVLQPSTDSLMEYSAGLVCHRGLLQQLRRRRAGPRKLLPALAKAVGYRREAALVFAAAGDLKATRLLEARQADALAEAKRLLQVARWDGVAVRHEFWSFIYLGAPAQQLLLKLAAQDTSWFSSNAIAVLIREPGSRTDALELLHSRVLPQQFEIADRMDWTDDGLLNRLRTHQSGEHALRLRATLRAVRRAWRTCQLDDLVQIAQHEVQRSRLAPAFFPALVAFIAENPLVHLHDHGCDRSQFGRARASWEAKQPAEIHDWLARSRPRSAHSGRSGSLRPR